MESPTQRTGGGRVLLFSLLPVFCFWILSAEPAGAVELRLTGPCSALPGTTVEFLLEAYSSEVITVAAYQADLIYDPSVLQFVSYQGPLEGGFSSGPTRSTSTPGSLSVAGLSCGSMPPGGGSLLLGRARFNVVGPAGSSTGLSLSGPSVLDRKSVV